MSGCAAAGAAGWALPDALASASTEHRRGTHQHVRHVATLGVPPPRDPHDRVQSRRFLRALLLRCLVLSVTLWALVVPITDLSTSWLVVLGGGALVVLAADVLWLSYRVRRDKRRPSPE
jgi:hypothetical protein